MTDLRTERNARLMGPYLDDVALSVSVPERGLDELLATVARTPQQRRHRFMPWSRPMARRDDTPRDLGFGGASGALHQQRATDPDLGSQDEDLPSMPLKGRRSLGLERFVSGVGPSLFASATRFVALSLIVAVVGLGIVMRFAPRDAQPAVVPGASATADVPREATPTAATPSAAPSTPATSAGFWDVLVTEPVVPGVRKVLRDTAGNDLSHAWSTAISSSGDIWIARKDSLVRAGHADTIPVDPAGRARGLPDHLIEQPEGRMSFAPPQGNLVFDGSEWVPITGATVDYDAALNAGGVFDEPTTLLRDGAVWGQSIDLAGDSSLGPIITRFDATGPVRFSSDQHGLAAGRDDCESRMPNHSKADKICGIHGAIFEAAPDGATWAGYSGYGGGLARFDGSEWTAVRPTGAAPHFGVRDIAAAPDGTIWVTFEERLIDFQPDGGTKLKHLEKRAYLARLDGDGWTTFKVPRIMSAGGHVEVAPNGTLWWVGEALTSFDGRQWKRYPSSGAFRLQHENDLSVGPDGSVLLAVRREVKDDDSRHERVLYLLDPGEAATDLTRTAKVRTVP